MNLLVLEQHSAAKTTYTVDENVEKPFPTNTFPRDAISMSIEEFLFQMSVSNQPSFLCEGGEGNPRTLPIALSTPLSFQVSLRS